jgi:hypothetical protein
MNLWKNGMVIHSKGIQMRTAILLVVLVTRAALHAGRGRDLAIDGRPAVARG